MLKGEKVINKTLAKFEKITEELTTGEELLKGNKTSNDTRIMLMQEENKRIVETMQKAANFKSKIESLLK